MGEIQVSCGESGSDQRPARNFDTQWNSPVVSSGVAGAFGAAGGSTCIESRLPVWNGLYPTKVMDGTEPSLAEPSRMAAVTGGGTRVPNRSAAAEFAGCGRGGDLRR